MSRPLVYVAGPYTNPDPILNVRNAIFAGEVLWQEQCAPLVPHLSVVWHLVSPHKLEWWYALDLYLLERCDALVRLPGDSEGADREVRQAQVLGIPAIDAPEILDGVVPEDLLRFLTEWFRKREAAS